MTRYLIANLTDGKRLQVLPVISGPYSAKLGTADDIQVVVDMNDPDVIGLNPRVSAAKGRTILAAVEGTTIMAAGPIWGHVYDRDAGKLTLTAKGIRSMFNYRYVLPVIAATTSLSGWLSTDPNDSSKTVGNPALATRYNDVSYATMAKRAIQQALAWTGGQLPIDFSGVPDEAVPGLTQGVDGVDFKTVAAFIDSLSGLSGGPEIEFRPQLTPDGLGIQFVAQMGTRAQPLVFSPQRPRWNVTAPHTPVSNFVVTGDGSVLASNSWAVGGRTAGTVVVSRATDPTLVNVGYPLLEVVDSTHSSVSEQTTLDGYALQNLADGQHPLETWAFNADTYPVDEYGQAAGPQVGTYQTGDYAELFFDGYAPASADGQTPASGDAYMQEPSSGTLYVQRILSISGDEKGSVVKIACAPQEAI